MSKVALGMRPALYQHWKKIFHPTSFNCVSSNRPVPSVQNSSGFLKAAVSREQNRHMASMAPLERKVSKVTQHLMYHQYHPEETERGKTPIVLFLPWITVTGKSARRFEDVYAHRGFNVLTVWNEVKYFVWPKSAFSLSKEVLEYLQAEVDCDLVVHGMSIGAYLYMMIVMAALQNPQHTSYLRDHVKGNIFDSIVCGGVNQMALGVSKMVANNVALEKLIQGTILTYFNLTKSHTVDLYNDAIQLFYDNPFLPSSLLLYSTVDRMSDPETVESIARAWEDRGVQVMLQKWTDSKHVELMKDHTVEYIECLDEYLTYIKMGNRVHSRFMAKL